MHHPALAPLHAIDAQMLPAIAAPMHAEAVHDAAGVEEAAALLHGEHAEVALVLVVHGIAREVAAAGGEAGRDLVLLLLRLLGRGAQVGLGVAAGGEEDVQGGAFLWGRGGAALLVEVGGSHKAGDQLGFGGRAAEGAVGEDAGLVEPGDGFGEGARLVGESHVAAAGREGADGCNVEGQEEAHGVVGGGVGGDPELAVCGIVLREEEAGCENGEGEGRHERDKGEEGHAPVVVGSRGERRGDGQAGGVVEEDGALCGCAAGSAQRLEWGKPAKGEVEGLEEKVEKHCEEGGEKREKEIGARKAG